MKKDRRFVMVGIAAIYLLIAAAPASALDTECCWITPHEALLAPREPSGIISAEDTNSIAADSNVPADNIVAGTPSPGSSVQTIFPPIVGVGGTIPMDDGGTASLADMSVAMFSILVDTNWTGTRSNAC